MLSRTQAENLRVPRGSTQPSGLSATKKNSHLGKLLLKEKDHAVLFFLAQVGTVRWRVEVGTLYAGVKRGFRNTTYQLIQAVTFWFPIVGGRQQPLKGTLNHRKKVTKNCQEPKPLFATGHPWLGGGERSNSYMPTHHTKTSLPSASLLMGYSQLSWVLSQWGP